jgi:hypothetical protein
MDIVPPLGSLRERAGAFTVVRLCAHGRTSEQVCVLGPAWRSPAGRLPRSLVIHWDAWTRRHQARSRWFH